MTEYVEKEALLKLLDDHREEIVALRELVARLTTQLNSKKEIQDAGTGN